MAPEQPDSENLGDRRRNPRLDVRAGIYAHAVGRDAPITILNLGRDGFLMQASIAFPLGAIDKFRFSIGRRDPIVLRARIAHGMTVSAGDSVYHLMGLEFLDRGVAGVEQAIDDLISASCRPAVA